MGAIRGTGGLLSEITPIIYSPEEGLLLRVVPRTERGIYNPLPITERDINPLPIPYQSDFNLLLIYHLELH